MPPNATAPLIAFLTPVYNGATFLRDAMESVQRQDYPNLVHIVVDNASTDSTPQILSEYANARVPVQVTRNEATLPVVENFNRVVELAPKEAKYVKLLCADDMVMPAYASKLTAVAERYPSIGIVGCLVHESNSTEDAKWPADREVFAGIEAIRRVFLDQGIIRSPHVLIRRDLLDSRMPFYTPGLFAADTDATLDLLTRCDWGFVHEDLALARVHPGTVTNREVFRFNLHYFEWLQLMDSYSPSAFGAAERIQLRARFRAHYLRALVRWRLDGRQTLYNRHMSLLKLANKAPTAQEYAFALWDWALIKAGAHPPWTGWPFDSKI